jgi:hypothetical protein
MNILFKLTGFKIYNRPIDFDNESESEEYKPKKDKSKFFDLEYTIYFS